MKKNKLFNSQFLALFLGLSLFGLTPIFALDEDDYSQAVSTGGVDLTNQVMALNAEIKAVAIEEKDYFMSGAVDDSCIDNFTILHNQFMDVLVHYKPFEVKWVNFNPIKNFRVTPGNADELSALLQSMQDTKDRLNTIFVQMQNLTDCSVPVVYDTATYVYPAYTVYAYDYPDYADYYYPLLFGLGAWGLWNSWGWWDGHHWKDKHGNHHHHGDHRRNHRGDHKGDHRGTGTHRNSSHMNRGASHTNRGASHMNRGTSHMNRGTSHMNRGSNMGGGGRGHGGGGGGGGGRGHGGGGGGHGGGGGGHGGHR